MVSFGLPRHFYLLLYYCLALFISLFFLLFAFCGKLSCLVLLAGSTRNKGKAGLVTDSTPLVGSCVALLPHQTQLRIKTDSAQSPSNKCKNYLLKIYSQHINVLNTI